MADRVKLMVYDWSVGSPGPISPMSWVNLVIAYNDPIVPNGKLQLGIPSYGRDWGRQVNSGEICPDGALATHSIELDNMQGLISAHGSPALVRDGSGEVKFSYDVVETGYSTTPIPAPPYTPAPAGDATGRPGSRWRVAACTSIDTADGAVVVHRAPLRLLPGCDHHRDACPGRRRCRMGRRRVVGVGLRNARGLYGARQHCAVACSGP